MSRGGPIVDIEWPEGLPRPVNALHGLVYRAGLMLRIGAAFGEIGDPRDPLDVEKKGAVSADLSTEPNGRIRQLNAVQRSVDRLVRDGLEIAHIDWLAWCNNGLDILAFEPRTGRAVIVEVKATSKTINAGLRSHLRSTRTKGRQMTWEWVWRSTVEMACEAGTAAAFLRVVRPLLDGRAERQIHVWSTEDQVGLLSGEGCSRIWSEGDLLADPEFAVPLDPDIRLQLTEMDRLAPGALELWSERLVR